MVVLSVNINKIALIRNSRGSNMPNLLKVALDLERFGAQGITVHPRPDARHITYDDCVILRQNITTELNIEGNPTPDFVKMVCEVKPAQVTLVPDDPQALTSNAGWNTIKYKDFLYKVINEFKKHNIRTSVFIDTDLQLIEEAANCGADRIELYTEHYAKNYLAQKNVVNEYVIAAEHAVKFGLGVNAGHDLNLDNLAYFKQNVTHLKEVSIGHALVCDALYYGFDNTINMYKRCLV